MIIDNLEEWCRKNAGRAVKTSHISRPIGRVLGFKRETGCVCLDGGGGRPSPNSTTVFVVDVDKTKNIFRWIGPTSIIDFVDKPAPVVTKGRVISEFPHVCPMCKGPAYIGFMTTVDCQKKCGVRNGLL